MNSISSCSIKVNFDSPGKKFWLTEIMAYKIVELSVILNHLVNQLIGSRVAVETHSDTALDNCYAFFLKHQ